MFTEMTDYLLFLSSQSLCDRGEEAGGEGDHAGEEFVSDGFIAFWGGV